MPPVFLSGLNCILLLAAAATDIYSPQHISQIVQFVSEKNCLQFFGIFLAVYFLFSSVRFCATPVSYNYFSNFRIKELQLSPFLYVYCSCKREKRLFMDFFVCVQVSGIVVCLLRVNGDLFELHLSYFFPLQTFRLEGVKIGGGSSI